MTQELLYRGPVTGLSFHRYAAQMDHLEAGQTVFLGPVKNQYDPHAIGVFFRGEQIGWIPKARNQELSEYLRGKSAPPSLEAKVLSHDTNRGLETRLLIAVPSPSVNHTHTPSATATHSQEKTMSKISNLIEINKTSATSAAYMEAGHIANKQLGKVMSKQLPMMVRGYADTPLGHLIMANLAVLAIDHFRPDQRQLRRLAQAMQVQAYQELLQKLDIDGMIDDLLDNGGIKRALAKLQDTPEED